MPRVGEAAHLREPPFRNGDMGTQRPLSADLRRNKRERNGRCAPEEGGFAANTGNKGEAYRPRRASLRSLSPAWGFGGRSAVREGRCASSQKRQPSTPLRPGRSLRRICHWRRSASPRMRSWDLTTQGELSRRDKKKPLRGAAKGQRGEAYLPRCASLR